MAARASTRREAPLPTYPRTTSARLLSGTRVVPDSSETFVAGEGWLGTGDNVARRVDAIVDANAGLLKDFGVHASLAHRKGEPGLLLGTSTRIGALPLLSPISGRPDFGLVIEPRFTWASAGDMLAGTGFRVVPELLPLPNLPQSERRVPPWVLSSVVLQRLRDLLDTLQRRFVMTGADLPAPRGSVDWGRYAGTRLAYGRALDVPCTFPDLREDGEIRSAIHWVLRRHQAALTTQAGAGLVVRRLLAMCDTLLARVANTVPRVPAPGVQQRWAHRPFAPRAFKDGLQAVDWTIHERGLAGLSDVAGLSWRMDMEVFFEAWVEAVAADCAKRTGCRLRVGRKQETRVPLDWSPASTGSQRALIPDLVMQREGSVLVLDAKYKRHAEQIERLGWSNADDELREQHRNDVLQALAYSTLFDAQRVVACLVYPARMQVWQGLVDRGRAVMRAGVRAGSRHVELALLAVPLSGDTAPPSALIERLLHAD